MSSLLIQQVTHAVDGPHCIGLVSGMRRGSLLIDIAYHAVGGDQADPQQGPKGSAVGEEQPGGRSGQAPQPFLYFV